MGSNNLLKLAKKISTRIINLSLASIIGLSSLVAATPLLFPASASALVNNTFYVNSSWLGTTPGTDPDGAGPATNFGTDSFSTIQYAINAATAGDVIQISGTHGSASLYTRYDVPVEKTGITLQGMAGNLVYGTFVVQADGVTITGMNIQYKGDDLSGEGFNRGGIYARVNSITITGNTITNGLGTSAGIANGMQIMRASNVINTSAADYTITGNTISGNQAVYPGYSSAGILVPQNASSGTAGGAYYSILVNDNQIATQNTFDITTPDVIDYVHQDWHNFVGPNAGEWSYSKVSNSAGLSEAILNSAAGATILVAAGTYTTTGQVVISKNLTIVGADKDTTIIKPAQDTGDGSSGNARGWFLVNAGTTFNLSNVTLDGTGHLIYMGLYYWGNGTVDNVNITNIKYNESGPDYQGRGMIIKGNVDVTNSTFTQIGRIGVQYFGGSGTASGNIFTGKGAGNWLDYGIELGAGAVATLSNNIITGNTGVATVDNSTSAGILVTTYFGAGTTATITGNTVTSNTDGIAVGDDSSDTSTVTAHQNNLSGNAVTGLTSTSSNTVNATNNWWGSANPTFGSIVSGNVDYTPWYTNDAMNTSSTADDLTSLSLSSGTLSPSFSSATTSYSATVTNSVTGVSVTDTPSTGASAVVSGEDSLAVGANTLTVIVTSADSTANKTYTITVTRAKADQTITFGTLAARTYGDANFGVSASADSGLSVTFNVGVSDQCTISGSTIHITGAGSCTVTAHQTGNGNYNAAPDVPRTFTVNKADPTIVVTLYSVTYDAAPHTATHSALGVHSEALSGLNVSGTTHTVAGNYATDAWAFTDVTGNYNDDSGIVNDTIAAADASISINVYTGIYDGAAHGVSISVATGIGGADLTDSVNLGGTFTNVPGGTANWTFSNANYNPQNGSTSITISKADQTITFSTLANRTYGDPNFDVSATASSSLAVSFTASGTCSVTEAIVHITLAGTCTVTAHQIGNGNYNAATDVNRSFTVNPPVDVTNQVLLQPTTNLSGDITQVAVGGETSSSTINVPAYVTDATLDVAALLTSTDGTRTATLAGDININSVTGIGQVTVTMPAGLTITGPADWDGTINLPKVVTTTVTLPVAPGFTPTSVSSIEVGFGDVALNFSKPVRLVFAGKAGKLVGWSRSGVFSLITAVCTSDSVIGMPSGANECKIDSGADMAVWTKHFTTFVTYTQSPTYTVVAGDTLSSIGASVGVDWHLIASTNGISAPYTIYPGQVLQLPASATPASTSASQTAGSGSAAVLGESINPQIGTAVSTAVSKPAVVASIVTPKKANWFNKYWFYAGIAVALLAVIYYVYQAADKKPKN